MPDCSVSSAAAFCLPRLRFFHTATLYRHAALDEFCLKNIDERFSFEVVIASTTSCFSFRKIDVLFDPLKSYLVCTSSWSAGMRL